MDNMRPKSSNGFLSRIKYVKNIEIYVCITLVLVLLLIYFGSVGSGSVANKEMNSEEARLSQVLTNIKGVGSVNVMITRKSDNDNNAIEGIVVVAKGADDVKVKIELIKAVCFAMNVNANQVEVFEMK
ncbi:MAG: hypothetical protein RR107_00525 [Clostridia bacterium]